jgi:glycosyltransferase involved in cell wall biosynthesis
MYYRAMMHASGKLATKIITDSVFSKDEIIRYLGVGPDKVAVIYPAVDTGFGPSDPDIVNATLSKHKIDRDFIFYAGICKPRKNHAGLLRAFKCFLESGGDAQLVITGPLDDGEQYLRGIAGALGVTERVIFTGFINDEELCALYTAARVYACPSLYEGFGFTVLEAMACGTPVVCSDTASLPEVAGNAALYANANHPKLFGEALYRVCTDELVHRDLIERAHKNLRRFSWDQAATSCLQIYDESIGRSRKDTFAVT